MDAVRTKVGENGRLVIPARIRRALHIDVGDTVVLRVENNELRVSSVREAVRRAQELVAKHVPEGVSLMDELIAERRRELRRE